MAKSPNNASTRATAPAPSGANGQPRERLSRDDILDVARRQFALNGYRGTNLGTVSSALGVTRQAIYYYFSKKHDVLVGLFERFFDRLDAAADEASATEGGPGARFSAMLEAHVRTVASDPDLSSLFTAEGRGNLPAGPAALIQARRKAYHSRFLVQYEAGVAAGELNSNVPPTVAVDLLLGAANWVFRWYNPSGRLRPAELATLTQAFLATGYAAHRATP